MLSIAYRKMGVRLNHVYFANDYELKNIRKTCKMGDVIFLHGVDLKLDIEGFLLTEQKTLVKDLTLSEEELFGGLSKHLRQYVKRNYKDPVDIVIYEAEEILKKRNLLDECKCLYEKMFNDKGMRETFNKKLAMEYCR
jgi:hypothetical protein